MLDLQNQRDTFADPDYRIHKTKLFNLHCLFERGLLVILTIYEAFAQMTYVYSGLENENCAHKMAMHGPTYMTN